MRRNWTDTVKLHNARVRATQIALDKGELVRCRWCETPTASLGTRECDRCWELRHRIEQDPALAERMLHELGACQEA